MGPTERVVPSPLDRGPYGRSIAGDKARVLVVDDDPRVRSAIGQTIALEIDLVLVARAADAATALVLFEGADPSVALVDLALPDTQTGLDLVRDLALRPGCAVVAMSIYGGLRESALGAGAVRFVEKDGDIDAVLKAIRAASALGHGPRTTPRLRHLAQPARDA
jgi:DNA-binding NarL/FixJ family response regulator